MADPVHNDPTFVSFKVDAILTALSLAFTAGSRPLGRVVRFSGIPSWDCEMLAAWTGMRLGGRGTIADADPVTKAVKPVVEVNLLLLRCVTALNDDGTPPSEALVDADGDGFMTDMWIMQHTIDVGLTDGTLWPACSAVNVRPIRPLSPSGNLSGMTTTIEVTL